ncbi:ketopantoate reductase PanE/ApbA-domain-containing protein [Leucosporidium creatinivorum]|uniref:Ketopantoate reductase PanE/ApbA-domain-containing protein n=1 Tax=Leucosporidium creatinivorum TaxID=106004 RepID=A0A1Y2ECH9_9BASI|nr:ketopantoate reductase PanE/ApbA-domain-containing protein [Leucosporidium creatinivorum]
MSTIPNQPTRILIVGTGAVGAFYGSRLALAPQTLVSVTCRSNYSAVLSSGLQLDTHSFGSYHFAPHAVYPSISAAAQAPHPFDYVVVATKALPDVSDDSEMIAPVVQGNKETAIVLIQNGVGVEQPHRQRFPNNPVLSAVTVVSAQQTSPGSVKQNRWTRISVGPFLQGGIGEEEKESELKQRSEKANRRFVELLKEGGIADAEEYDEKGLQLVRWHKLAINSSMNPSSVLSGSTGNSRMSLDPELRLHLAGCMNEIFQTAPKVLGRPWPEKLAKVDADKILKSSERNSEGLPSMLVDWQAGRPMELEVILGNPIRIARAKGIEMPRLQSLYALLKMASIRRQEDQSKAKL